MKKRAYLYIRFSRLHQERGDSKERQSDSAEKYCRDNGFELDRSSYLDLGVSAFKGRNAKAGALGRFMEACEAGRIPPGSALIIESLDRLSRDTPWRSIGLLRDLLEYGIETHITLDNLVIKPEDDGGRDLMLITMLASRAHEESKTKSKRLISAFAKKRELAAKGEARVAKSLPWWLESRGEKIECPPEKRKIVQRIFKETARGQSSAKIARALNSGNVPTFRKQKKWMASRVRDLIRSNSPLGILEATQKTKHAGRDHKIPGYYPRIISPDLADLARHAMRENDKIDRGRPPEENLPCNLFRGLLRFRGKWMSYSRRKNGFDGASNGYYVCNDEEAGKTIFSVSGRQLESVFLAGVSELTAADLRPPARESGKLGRLRKKERELEVKIAHLVEGVESGSTNLAKRLVAVEAEMSEVNAAINAASEVEPQVDRDGVRLVTRIEFKNLHDKNVRDQAAMVINRMVSRIDVGKLFCDVPVREDLEEEFMWQIGSIPDPSPTRGRKPLCMVVTFKTGAQRLIWRTWPRDLGITSVRVEPENS